MMQLQQELQQVPNLKATYNYNTEGLAVYVPGSGILFKDGIVYNLAGANGSVTVTITGA